MISGAVNMKFKKLYLLLVTLILAFSFSVGAHEKKWPEKRLRQAWPQAQSFTSKQISLAPSQISKLANEGVQIRSEDRSPTFYFVQEKTSPTDKAKTIGIILFVDEYGANGVMEISVAMGSDGQTKKIDIWEHSENSLVAKEEFLKQFLGKTAKNSFMVSKDYQPVAEAVKASEAIAKAVEKALKITDIVFAKK